MASAPWTSKPSEHEQYYVRRNTNDPFARHNGPTSGLLNALLATPLTRSLHITIFFTLWAAGVILFNSYEDAGEDPPLNGTTPTGGRLAFSSTTLTVFGTVLGFVVSHRTATSFDRYNEGRRYWSAIVYGSRLLARTIWFHVPDLGVPLTEPLDQDPVDMGGESRVRAVIEKKSIINLIEAFAVSVKHRLRGERSIYYTDLYHLVKHLPSYAFVAGGDPDGLERRKPPKFAASYSPRQVQTPPTARVSPLNRADHTSNSFPPINTRSPWPQRKSFPESISSSDAESTFPIRNPSEFARSVGTLLLRPSKRCSDNSTALGLRPELAPSWNPPQLAFFDFPPFSLLNKTTSKSEEFGPRTSAMLEGRGNIDHNIPLELSFYISSYISTLRDRKVCDVPTHNNLFAGLNQLVDALTGLERIVTTPMPFSYSMHLWTVTVIYVALLPFQLWDTLRYLAIPATTIAAFIFFGFIVAGEEIENPFGYDRNHLNLDYLIEHTIKPELHALTSLPTPDIGVWAFYAGNTHIFSGNGHSEVNVTPGTWLSRGEGTIRDVLAHRREM